MPVSFMKEVDGSAVDLGLKGKRVVIPASTKGILRRVVDQLVDEDATWLFALGRRIR